MSNTDDARAAAQGVSPVTRAGRVVKDARTGRIGITTDSRRVRTPTIPVMFVGSNYPVMCQIADLVPADFA